MTAMRLVHPDGQVFSFDAGALCLELAVTSGGEGFRARFEVIHSPADIARWAATTRLDLAGHGVDPAEVRADQRQWEQLRRLREAIWSAAEATADGRRPGAEEIAVINELAAGAPPTPQLEPGSLRMTWRRPVTAAQLTAAIARDAVATFQGPGRGRIRRCAGRNCYLLYLDTSRPGQRRWCSMQRCGNRHKAAGHRQRLRED